MPNIYQTTTLNKAGKEIYYPTESYDQHDVVKVVETFVNQGGTEKSGPTSAYTVSEFEGFVQKKYNFYYARNPLSANNHGSDFQTPTLDIANWGGIEEINGVKIPSFFWVPGYGSSVDNRPTVQNVTFGDGYSQRVSDSINSNLLNINLTFDKRRKKEATAILHFLHQRKGVEKFLFSPPEPYNPIKKSFYVCMEWNSAFVFFDNYTITATFKEVAA